MVPFIISMIDKATGCHTLVSSSMDKDWYYRWLLFSNIQQQKDKLFKTPGSRYSMEVVVCGLCGTTGATVHQSPNTLNRLLKTLDLNKLPPLLTEERVQSKIGLCENCEKKNLTD